MRAQIDRLRSGRDVFKEKYEAAQARLAESERRASDLEGRLAAKSEDDVSQAATTSDFSELVERLEEVTASCENALAKQRERFKVKLAASKSHSDQISTDLKAAHSQAAVCAREVAELRLENKSLEERMGELRIALAEAVVETDASHVKADPVETPAPKASEVPLSTVVSDAAGERSAEVDTPEVSEDENDEHACDEGDDTVDATAAAVDEAPEVTRANAAADACMARIHKMSHNLSDGESSGDDGSETAVEFLARKGAKSTQLGLSQADRLKERATEQSRRLQFAADAADVECDAERSVNRKAAFRVEPEPLGFDFSDGGGTPAASTPLAPARSAARGFGSAVASAAASLKEAIVSSAHTAATPSQLSCDGMSIGFDFEESVELASGLELQPGLNREEGLADVSPLEGDEAPMSLDDSFSMGDPPSVVSQRTQKRRAQSGWSEVAGMPGGGGDFDDVEISVAERQARAAERAAEAAMRTARATEASKVFDGERLRMQQEQIEISRAKLLGSTDIVDMHDSNDMKCLRMLFNSCAGELDQQPAAALAEKPTPSSAVATSNWVSTVQRRIKSPLERVEKFKLRFTPTDEIVKLTAKCRFGLKGLHPERFVTYSFDNAVELSKTISKENFKAKGLTVDLITTDADAYKTRCRSFTLWVACTLSPGAAARLWAVLKHTCDLCLTDTKGKFSLPELKKLHLDLLDRLQLKLEGTLEEVKKVCAGQAEGGDESFYPRLSLVREVATRPMAGTRRTRFDPVWTILVVNDVVDAEGDVAFPAVWAELRLKQLQSSEFDEERRKRDKRAELLNKLLTEELVGKKEKKATAAKKEAAGGVPPSEISSALTLEHAGVDATARELAQVKEQLEQAKASAKQGDQRHQKQQLANIKLTKAGKWTVFDQQTCLTTGSVGMLIGPTVRLHCLKAGAKLVGMRLMTKDEISEFRANAECRLEAEGVELCIRNISNDKCPFKDDPSKCNYHHLDNKAFPPHGLPADCNTPAKLQKKPKLLRMFFVSLGGMVGDVIVPPDQREAAVEKLRASAGSGALPPEGSGTLPPQGVYEAVITDGNPLGAPLRELMTETGEYLGDVAMPPPVRSLPDAAQPCSAAVECDDVHVPHQELATPECGEFWGDQVRQRVSAGDATNEFFVYWAARIMAGKLGVSCSDSSAINSAFESAMSLGVARAHRTLLPVCSKYAPQSADQVDVRAAGYRGSNGLALVMMSSASPLDPKEPSGIQVHTVELFGALFTAIDCGSLVTMPDGEVHDEQCVPITYSMLDLIYDDVPLTMDLVRDRSTRMCVELRKQAAAALHGLGPQPSNLSVGEAELYTDVRDLLSWGQKDIRFVTHFGRELEASVSARSWMRLRLVLVCCGKSGHSMRLYCITGPEYCESTGWTAFALVYNHHCVPLKARAGVFAGEAGSSRFLRHAMTYGVAPVTIPARSWQDAVIEYRSSDEVAGSDAPLAFPADMLMRNVRLDAVSQGLISGQTGSFGVPFRSTGPSPIGQPGSFGVPFRAPGPPKLCMNQCGRACNVQHNYHEAGVCCLRCYYTNTAEHSEMCDTGATNPYYSDESNKVGHDGGPSGPPASSAGRSSPRSSALVGLKTRLAPVIARWVARWKERGPADAPGVEPSTGDVGSTSEAPGPPRFCWNMAVCGQAARTQSQFCDFCCGMCAATTGVEHNDYCRFHRTAESDSTSERPHQGGRSPAAGSGAGSAAAASGVDLVGSKISSSAFCRPVSALEHFDGASVLVVSKLGCLLGRPKAQKWWHDFGGEREGDETPLQTATRELRQEAGISIADLTISASSPVVVSRGGYTHFVFVATTHDAVSGESWFPNPSDTDGELHDFEWFSSVDEFMSWPVHARIKTAEVHREVEKSFGAVLRHVCSVESHEPVTRHERRYLLALELSGALKPFAQECGYRASMRAFSLWVVRRVMDRLSLWRDAAVFSRDDVLTRHDPRAVDWSSWVTRLSAVAVRYDLVGAKIGGARDDPPALPGVCGTGADDVGESIEDDAVGSDTDEPPLLCEESDSSDEEGDDDSDDVFFDSYTADDDSDDTFFDSCTEPTERGGKSKERRQAEQLEGPVVVPDRNESPDSKRFRGHDYDTIMAMKLSAEQKRLGEALCDSAEFEYTESAVMSCDTAEHLAFLEHFVKSVALGDELTALCKSVRCAIAVFRHCWWLRHDRFAVPERMENVRGLVDDCLLDYIEQLADRGVEVRTGAPPPEGMTNVRAHQTIDEHPTEALVKVWEDFKRCGAFFVSDKSIAFLGDVQCAPMSRVDKHDDEGFVDATEGGRFIFDAKHGATRGLNKKTPVTTHPPSAAPSHLSLIFFIVWICLQFPGVPILCCKIDVKAAFKLIWIAISDSNWFGARFASSMFGKARPCWKHLFILFTVLQFGWSESPGEYGVFGWCISAAHRALGPSVACQLAALAFFNLVFVDDAAIFEPDMFGRAQASRSGYMWVLAQILGKALNIKKLAIDGMLALSHIFWGITYHLERASDGPAAIWVEMTRSKKRKSEIFMKQKHAQPGERAIKLVDHQRLVGNVQWWSVCAPALRGLLAALYAMSSSASDMWLQPKGSDAEVKLAWEEYDDTKTLLAMLVEMGSEQASYFQSPIVDSLDFYDLAHIPRGLGVKVRYVGSDSNGHETGGIMSGIDYSEGTWTFARAAEYGPALLSKLGIPESELTKDLIIFVTELLVVIAMAAEHGASWSGYVVASLIDNDNAKEAINHRRSKNRYVRYLLLILVGLEFRFKFRLVAYYVSTKSNWLLDGIGRFERFKNHTDAEVQSMIQTELIDAHVPGLVFEPLTALLDFFTKGGTVLKSFALPDGSVDHIAARHELAISTERPKWPDSTFSRSDALAMGSVGFGGVCSGTGVLESEHAKSGVPTVFFNELEKRKFAFMDALHPRLLAKYVHRCRDLLGCEYESWAFRGLLPRIVGGGPPCVFAAWSGRRKGTADARSRPFTIGVPKIVAALEKKRPSSVWAVVIENVEGVLTVGDGEALVTLLKGLYVLGFALTPRPVGGLRNIQVVEAHLLGGRAVRPRVCIYLEKRWIIRTLGHASRIEYQQVVPKAISEVLEADELVHPSLIMPGRFYPLSGAKPDERGCVLAGYQEYGGEDDPVIRGSLVKLVGSDDEFRVMLVRGSTLDVMKNSNANPDREDRVPFSKVTRHLRERRRVNHPDGGASIITRFGEPGLVGGPGHQLVLRGVGVTWFTARELWRLQGNDIAETDARYDEFVRLHPSASYEVLAGAAGDAIASCWAKAVAERSTDRCARAVVAAARIIAKWAEMSLRRHKAGPSQRRSSP